MALAELLSSPTGWTTIGLAVTALIVVSLSWRPARKQDVPLASGGLPLLGHAIPFLKDASKLAFTMKKRYGSIYSLNVAGQTITILTDVVSGMRVILRADLGLTRW